MNYISIFDHVMGFIIVLKIHEHYTEGMNLESE